MSGKMNAGSGVLLIDSGQLESKREKINALYNELTSFSETYISKNLFSTSQGKSMEAYEELLENLVIVTKTMSTILQQTSAYITLIENEFDENDKELANQFLQNK